jgi:hypothetical protein
MARRKDRPHLAFLSESTRSIADPQMPSPANPRGRVEMLTKDLQVRLVADMSLPARGRRCRTALALEQWQQRRELLRSPRGDEHGTQRVPVPDRVEVADRLELVIREGRASLRRIDVLEADPV